MDVRKITGGPGDVPKGPKEVKTGKLGRHEYASQGPKLDLSAEKTIKNTYLQSVRKHQGQQLNKSALPKDSDSANKIAQAMIAAAA